MNNLPRSRVCLFPLIVFSLVKMPDNAATETQSDKPDLKRTKRQTRRKEEVSPLDRLPPHSIEAEQGVLGCVMLNPNENMGTCIEKFKSGAEVFYDLRHRELYDLIAELYDKKQPIDIFTLSQSLRDRKQLSNVGGLAYLNDLMDKAPSGLNLPYYLEIVREKYVLRKMLHTCSDIVGRVYEEQDNVDSLLDTVERDVLSISEERSENEDKSIKTLVRDAISTLESYHKNQGMLTGLSSGFHDLDKMTHGMHPGEMVVIAARPSMGKTSLAMNIAEHVALEQNEPVGVFSLEMTAESLILRMLCCRARINLRAVRDGFFAERDFPRITQAATELAKAPIVIDDTPGLSVLQLRARARRMSQQHGIKLFVIDYLQLLNSTARRAENRQQEISDISSGVKALAKELSVPVIVLSQLNRELEKDKSRKPRMSDLRESGAIEQDADLIGLLYKPSQGDDDDGPAQSEQESIGVNMLIAKQRNGPTGDVNLTFFKGFTRFENAAKVSEEDVPAGV